MDKSLFCYKVEIKHGDSIGECTLKTEMETERAYEIIASKVCDEIKGTTLKITLKNGEVITKETTAEDIKDMWIEDIKQ